MTVAIPARCPLDDPLTPQVDTSVGAKSHLFQPPPLSASSSLQNSTASLATSVPSVRDTRGRKRTRHDFQRGSPSPAPGRPHMSCDSPSSLISPTLNSPAPLTDVRYKMAAGGQAPKICPKSQRKSNNEDNIARYYPNRRGIMCLDEGGSHGTPDHDDSIDDPSLLPKSPNIRDGVGNVIYRFAGVANKVWQNWSTTFRGFYSGGGQGFQMGASNYRGGGSPQWSVSMQDRSWRNDSEMPATPGGFPQEDYIPNYWLQDHTDTPPRKRNKRDPDMAASWVMIGSTPRSKDVSPTRSVQRKPISSPGSAKRAIPRSKRPVPPTSRSSFAGSPRLRSDHASYASPRSSIAGSPVRDSPVNAEVQKHAARIKRKEAEEDARLRSFNQQLKAMIREGKEALGTKFEVEVMDEDMIRDSTIFDMGGG